MTSKPGVSQLYVYITLPGQTSAVVAGKFELNVLQDGMHKGRFVYGKSYLARADKVEIDPFELKLTDETYETTRLKGLFGALRDASPDHWGRRIIERHLDKPELDELDYLLNAPEDRAGALGFGLGPIPPAPLRKFNQTIDLEKLQNIADALISEEEKPAGAHAAQVEELLLIGTSMGGARPKTVVEDPEGLWIAKFNRTDDKWNNARVEHAMLELAKNCGISTSKSRIENIAGRDVLLVKRFDREKVTDGYLRARMISALTLLRAEDSHQDREKWSYVLLAEELRRASSKPEQDASELFRRMCFNALISNTDDHPRNHALLAWEKGWRLSPAYDLTPTSPVSLERRDLALAIGDMGRFANAKNLLSQSMRFLLTKEDASAIIKQMEACVKASWHSVARAAGVNEHDCYLISGAFAYPGFWN